MIVSLAFLLFFILLWIIDNKVIEYIRKRIFFSGYKKGFNSNFYDPEKSYSDYKKDL